MSLAVILQNDLDDLSIPSQEQFQIWVDQVTKRIPLEIPNNANEVCIRIIDTQESSDLNEIFRKKTGPTNVLSFPNEIRPELLDTSIGDLAICAELVAKEAEMLQISIKNHWGHLTVHGILHLLGYDHINIDDTQKMESLEIDILKSLDIENPYRGHPND